jgi:hypothetical protein
MNLPVASQSRLPAHLQKAFGVIPSAAAKDDLSGGVVSGFPILSYKGKVWRIRKSGQEQVYADDDGNAIQSIEVILVNANPALSKIYYDKAYEEGSNEPPRCFSADGVRPDAGISQPISANCAACPKNAWGSGRPTPSGGKTRACTDSRRMAVAFRHELESKGKDSHLFLLRVPPSSLNPLKDYSEKVLKPAGIPYYALGTRIGFDTQVAHPKMTFKPTSFLTEEEAETVMALRDSDECRRILAEAEFEATGVKPDAGASLPTEPGLPEPAPAVTAAQAARVAPPVAAPVAPTPRKPKKKAADEETAGLSIIAPAPTKKAAPVAAPAPAEVIDAEVVEVEAPEAAAPKQDDFDNMLDSILKTRK